MASNSKVALVTGAGTGIGKSSVLQLLGDGYSVVLAGRRIEPLQEKAKKSLKGLKVNNVNFKVDDGNNLDQKKYDAILSAAAPLQIPQNLKERLSLGGKLLLPVGDSRQQILTLVKRVSKDKYIEEKLEEVLFVPLLKGVVS